MSKSSLVNYAKISPNSNNPRNHKIDTITIHHMAGNLSIEGCGELFADPARQGSSNYGVGTDGRIALYVDEANRAWTSGNAANDHRAVTIEVANDGGDPDWHVSDKALAATIDLCVDICQRNGIERLNYTGDKTGNLTMHKWFRSTLCPGPYLESKFPYIADEVNKRLGSAKLYTVQAGAFAVKANAEAMVKNLKAAGFDACIIESTVQTQPTTPEKSDEEIAREVLAGKWGNGTERKERLAAAGYEYTAIQQLINKLL